MDSKEKQIAASGWLLTTFTNYTNQMKGLMEHATKNLNISNYYLMISNK